MPLKECQERSCVMRICTCEACHYTFRYPIVPLRCPDCGKDAVREAAAKEIRQFHIEQEIIRKEVQLGIYAVAM